MIQMTRLEAINAAAAAYNPTPAPTVHRIGWQDISADVFAFGDAMVVGVKGTDPTNLANLERDADVRNETCRDHPQLGQCFEGALNAAEGLVPLVQALSGGRPTWWLGHSLGGQIAVDGAALMVASGLSVAGVYGFDPPKSGWEQLVQVLAPVTSEIDVFSGSVVNKWPFGRGVHVRTPITIGDWSPDWLTAHSITRAAAWVTAHDLVPA